MDCHVLLLSDVLDQKVEITTSPPIPPPGQDSVRLPAVVNPKRV
jgi:hypothetical protein